MKKSFLLLLLPMQLLAQTFSSQEVNRWQQQANRVTIIRDNWGVPHVYGKTDADCVFGLAYAQAEDNMEQLEDNFIRSIGKGSAIHGEQSWVFDRLVHAFEFVKLAKEEYNSASLGMKAIYDAYAAGVNYYLHKHPTYKPSLLQKIEPWHPLTMIRSFYYINDILGIIGVSRKNLQEQLNFNPEKQTTGSNAWAIGPKKTGTNSTMLFINPHRSIFGNGTFTEIHVESETGWKFSGTTKFGFVLPYLGHNGNIGYGFTVNSPDLGDQYIENFDHPTDPLMYKYGASYRKAVQWNDTIFLKMNDKVLPKIVSFLKTHHGPVINNLHGKPVTVRLANMERTGWFEQWYNMSKASNFNQFKKAASVLSFPYLNVVYADKKGNIFYMYYQASARRKEGIDWRSPVDGSDAGTEWRGYHSFEELPQILNPASGFVQSCNSDIEFTSGKGTFDKKKFPSYMIGNELNNPRAERSVALLTEHKKIDFNKWAEITMDVRVQLAEDSLTTIIAELEKGAKQHKDDGGLAPLIDELKKWDHLATTTSVAMTLFREMINYHRSLGFDFVTSLQKVKEKLEKLYGTWKVPWGDRIRLQKVDWEKTEKFSDIQPSYPLAGAPGSYGTIFCIGSDPLPVLIDDRKKLYHTFGSSYTSIIELGKKVRSKSITCFGQQEKGPHSKDQAPLFAKRQYKDAWFYKEDVLKHAERKYHPGE